MCKYGIYPGMQIYGWKRVIPSIIYIADLTHVCIQIGLPKTLTNRKIMVPSYFNNKTQLYLYGTDQSSFVQHPGNKIKCL